MLGRAKVQKIGLSEKFNLYALWVRTGCVREAREGLPICDCISEPGK